MATCTPRLDDLARSPSKVVQVEPRWAAGVDGHYGRGWVCGCREACVAVWG